jgi:hypothetical protein
MALQTPKRGTNMGILQETVDCIRSTAREGDVINLDPAHPSFIDGIGAAGIRFAQKKLFGEASNWRDSHSMIYFKNATIKECIGRHKKVEEILGKNELPFKEVFSVAPPKASFIPIEEFALDTVSVYRYAIRPLTPADIKIMLESTIDLLLTPYNYGMLLDIAIGEMHGYPFEQKTKIFDFGKKKKVCSVGVASVYQKWRKILKKQDPAEVLPRLFSKLNPEKWPDSKIVKEFRKDGHGWNVESTYPAQFANTDFFNNEFGLVLRIEQGRVVFKER